MAPSGPRRFEDSRRIASHPRPRRGQILEPRAKPWETRPPSQTALKGPHIRPNPRDQSQTEPGAGTADGGCDRSLLPRPRSRRRSLPNSRNAHGESVLGLGTEKRKEVALAAPRCALSLGLSSVWWLTQDRAIWPLAIGEALGLVAVSWALVTSWRTPSTNRRTGPDRCFTHTHFIPLGSPVFRLAKVLAGWAG
jgi:hypothetical protein